MSATRRQRGAASEAATTSSTVPDVDPRAVRVAAAIAQPDLPAMVVEPGPGGAAPVPGVVLVDGAPTLASIVDLGGGRAALHRAPARAAGTEAPAITRLLLEPVEPVHDGRGVVRREVVVDGWRIELELGSERRAALQDRARRGREDATGGGPLEVHAIIPGRIVSVSVVPGDAVVASQQMLVVEAMKMQNELRAPRDGVVTRVAVGPGETVEIGDLLLVLE